MATANGGEGITTNGVTITNLGSTNGNLSVISNDFYYTLASGRTHYFGGTPGSVANNLSVPLGTLNLGLQTASTIASFDASKNVVSLPLDTYPSLAELETVKGITTGVTIQSQINSKQAYAVAASGAVISFVTPQIYNSVASPATGNITDNGLTGAKIGVVQKIYHQSGTAPTFGAGGWKKLGTGTYSTTLLNVIYCEWVSGARVEYWIVQSEA